MLSWNQKEYKKMSSALMVPRRSKALHAYLTPVSCNESDKYVHHVHALDNT